MRERDEAFDAQRHLWQKWYLDRECRGFILEERIKTKLANKLKLNLVINNSNGMANNISTSNQGINQKNKIK